MHNKLVGLAIVAAACINAGALFYFFLFPALLHRASSAMSFVPGWKILLVRILKAKLFIAGPGSCATKSIYKILSQQSTFS